MTVSKATLGSLLLAAYMTGLGVVLFDSLPDTLPMQFSLNGEPGNFQPKLFATALLPAFFIVLLIGIKALLKISPAVYSMPNSKNAVNTILFGVGLLLAASHTAILLHSDYTNYQYKIFSTGIALFLIVVGNVWGKTERNFFIGIRLPWTIASEANWKATHRMAGKLMVTIGVVLLAISPFSNSLLPAISLLVISVVIPVCYSYWYFTKQENNTRTSN